MSTINAANYGDGTDSVPASALLSGTEKAWVNVDGTGTVNIREGYNMASVTDDAAGRYSFTLTNSMAGTQHGFVAASAGQALTGTAFPRTGSATIYREIAAGSFSILCQNITGSDGFSDVESSTIALLGDLA